MVALCIPFLTRRFLGSYWAWFNIWKSRTKTVLPSEQTPLLLYLSMLVARKYIQYIRIHIQYPHLMRHIQCPQFTKMGQIQWQNCTKKCHWIRPLNLAVVVVVSDGILPTKGRCWGERGGRLVRLDISGHLIVFFSMPPWFSAIIIFVGKVYLLTSELNRWLS